VLFAEAHARRRRRRRRQAAAAGCLILAGLLAAGLVGAWPGGSAPTAGRPAGGGLPAPPPYYVAIVTSLTRHNVTSIATVRGSATGAVLDTVRLPALDGTPSITAAGTTGRS
jgi:hypothetical protein